MALLELNERGLYCSQGDFYIDPWLPVSKAVITHAHSDHARWGMGVYLCTESSAPLLKSRLGVDIRIESLAYYQEISINGVKLSFYPAGHVLGSAQIRLEYKGEVWVASGDYKNGTDHTCKEFEPVKCNTFITESTFGLPVYQWQNQKIIFDDMNAWIQNNISLKRSSLIMAYSLGKAQRILSGIEDLGVPIFVHGSVFNISEIYKDQGVLLPSYHRASEELELKKSIIVAPPSVEGSAWLKKFGDISTAFASGWMNIRGNRRRRALDKGIVLSDHADWSGLISTIKETEAEKVLVTHGYTDVLVRYLNEIGIEAETLKTPYSGEIQEQEKMEGQEQ